MSTQPIALWLADKLEDIPSFDGHWLTINNAANELRRLHEESERLKAAAQRPVAEPHKWVGLEEEEIKHAPHHMVDGAYHYSFKQGAQWAEAKLREKNGGQA